MKQKFKEKAPSVIEKIKMAQKEAIEKRKRLEDERRAKNKDKGDIKLIDVFTGNLP